MSPDLYMLYPRCHTHLPRAPTRRRAARNKIMVFTAERCATFPALSCASVMVRNTHCAKSTTAAASSQGRPHHALQFYMCRASPRLLNGVLLHRSARIPVHAMIAPPIAHRLSQETSYAVVSAWTVQDKTGRFSSAAAGMRHGVSRGDSIE